MISFAISNSTKDLDGTHCYYQNELSFSSNAGNLKIPGLGRQTHLSLKISAKGSLIIAATSPFKVNGKNTIDKSFVKKNDLVEINQIRFKIIDYILSEPPLLKNIVNNNVDDLMKKNDSILRILQGIKKE